MRKFLVALVLVFLSSTAFAQTNVRVISIPPISSTAAEGSHVICASTCALYGGHVTAGASAGFLMMFNALTAPADGTVTPAMCLPVAANASVSVQPFAPIRFSTGLVAVFSTTGCFSKTVSATAYFSFEGL